MHEMAVGTLFSLDVRCDGATLRAKSTHKPFSTPFYALFSMLLTSSAPEDGIHLVHVHVQGSRRKGAEDYSN